MKLTAGLVFAVTARLALAQSSPFDPCPIPCSLAGSNPSNWTYLHGEAAIQRCHETTLFDMCLNTPIRDPNTHATFRACRASASDTSSQPIEFSSTPFSPGLEARQETGSRTGCLAGAETFTNQTDFEFLQWGAENDDDVIALERLVGATKQLKTHLASESECAPTIMFAQLNDTMVGLYVGSEIVKSNAVSLVQRFIASAQALASVPGQLAGQICDEHWPATWAFGIYVDSTGDIAAVQDVLKGWNEAKCLRDSDSLEVWENTEISLFKAIDRPDKMSLVSTGSAETKRSIHRLQARADCTAIQVVEGDGCWSLAQRCGITEAQLSTYNPASNFCNNLHADDWVCCSEGTLPDFSPQPNPDGSCASYSIQTDDNCYDIGKAFYITEADIDSYNANTWGWAGCGNLQPDQMICLSSGSPPMPAPILNAVCGPQVPGTVRQANVDLADLNPCPLNVCCNIWGQCGTTEEFCVLNPADTGAPGTSQPGANGCISNCGMDIVNNGQPPATFSRVAYYEAWNQERPCLHMSVTEIDTNLYTHIHFAFADITTTYEVSVSNVAQFELMKGMTGVKRIISFGGWAFSTEAPTYSIFREGVTPANRATFANNVIAFVLAHGLDGVDFDWEYPAAPDIPGIPPGILSEGYDYLAFLQLVKAGLPNKDVAVAAPASYWYLKGYPIKEIAQVVDYIVFMTYDLHGQWDYGNKWSNPGCEGGNCLRSHINITEVTNAYSMITKAGVPSHKIFSGISSYGRSFHMSQAGCTGPMCTFTGSAGVSDATPGRCTNTGGYLASAEIREIIHQWQSGARSAGSVQSYHDGASNSDILVYDGLEWVAWMSDVTKATRVEWIRGLNFGGVSDWAVDLDANGGLAQYLSPNSATVIPFPATTVPAASTFTIGGPVVTDVAQQPNSGNQNSPQGPGAANCFKCDLARLITSTCCGVGGSVSNPIEITPGVPIWRALILPGGFRTNQELWDSVGNYWSAGTIIPWEIIIPKGTTFLFPLVIPGGLKLSDRFSGDYGDNESDDTEGTFGVLYLTSTFWEGPHTVTCDLPCTIMFPPIKTTSTWTPGPLITTVTGSITTHTPPVQTTQNIRISKHTVKTTTGAGPTKTITPVPAPTPLCITLKLPILGTIQVGFCPPRIDPFPPPVPPVTIIPVPPGGKAGPTTPANKPSPEQEQEEEEEDEDEDGDVCYLSPESDDELTGGGNDGTGVDEPWDPNGGSGSSGSPGNGGSSPGSNNGAGVGNPMTTTITVTVFPTRTIDEPTATATATEKPVDPPPPPAPKPDPPPTPILPDPSTEVSTCFGRPNREVLGGTVQAALDGFCKWADGTEIRDNNFLQLKAPGDVLSDVLVSVQGKNDCTFTIQEKECKRILNKVVGCHPGGSLLRIGGRVESNCATWVLDPVENLHGECIPIPAFKALCKLIDFFAP